jgi:hypothetical protein
MLFKPTQIVIALSVERFGNFQRKLFSKALRIDEGG